MAYDFTWMLWPSHGWPKLREYLKEIFDTSSGHDHDGSNSKTITTTDLADVTASAAEINLNDSAVAGTAVASKTLALGATKNVDTLLIDVGAPVAAGNNQATATAMTADTNLVTAADGTKGVKLPTAVAGRRVIVKNTVENAVLKVYPATGAAINALSANTAISLPAGCQAVFVASSSTQWYTTAIPDGITATAAEINGLAGVVAGMATASKAAVLGADKNLDEVHTAALYLGAAAGTQVTATAAEVNLLGGAPLAATFVVASETGGNTINVAVQLTDGNGVDVAVRGSVLAYLSDDANGDSIASAAPSGGWAIGTDGLLIPVVASKCAHLVSESDGDIDINIIEAAGATWYLALVLPTGKLAVSGAITFAA